MSLEKEIETARTEIVSDGYEMSIGEIINLYKDKEILINPAYQRLFRWDRTRKTRFIVSILLGIPVPPIFVYQDKNGIWELIDGLQRLSTILQFMDLLPKSSNDESPLSLDATKFLPSLKDKKWEPTSDTSNDGIGTIQQLRIKRSRIRVEILKNESDPKAKYELFQRLNTGGAELSEQEVRNCVAVMLNPKFHAWLNKLASNPDFRKVIDQTEAALERQMAAELALRFLVFRKIDYQPGFDVHEYLDAALITLAMDESYDHTSEEEVFNETFKALSDALSDNAFKKWDGQAFRGQFLLSVFEVVAIGVSHNLSAIKSQAAAKEFIIERCKALWAEPVFQKNSGAGVRGTTRLAKLLPLARNFFRPI